jgi:hypothetical protein
MTFTSAQPAALASPADAYECRTSCSRTRGRPAPSTWVVNHRVNRSGLIRVPSGQTKTGPVRVVP